MKKKAGALCLLLALAVTDATAQSSVHAKDLTGVWQMTFELSEEGESPAEVMALGAVERLLNWIDIRFEFLPENRLKVMVKVLGEEEVEYGTWSVNDRRELVLDDTENFESEDTVWLFEDGRLTGYKYEDGRRVRSTDGVFLAPVS